ncbi:hypothetical protein HPB50_025931 [Hyalomma asiaticum]|uniref:Uncharacterized protein n=1 Tax=Hyalomma asiaticum TaxID=266040 RepID=A0ACB7S7Y4_HYAAI|nr:hypothetical protein HPB50_025931 [Hyalomma asiaticum]
MSLGSLSDDAQAADDAGPAQDAAMAAVWEALEEAGIVPENVALSDYVNADTNVIVYEELSDAEILKSAHAATAAADSSDDEAGHGVPKVPTPVTVLQVMDSLDNIHSFLGTHDNNVAMQLLTESADFTRQRIRQLLLSIHPDKPVAGGKPPSPLPDTDLDWSDRCLLLRLRTGSAWPAARMHLRGRRSSPACSRCGADETLEHIICSCPAFDAERRLLVRRYRLLGLPASSADHFLFPARQTLPALRAFLAFADAADLSRL